jgi:hypothetical protein
MIRRLGSEAQKVLFGLDKNEAYDQGICIRCGVRADSQRTYLELESICHTCYSHVSDIGLQPIPIKLSIQVGEHVGDCIAVPPEWDGFTCLNGLVSSRIPKDELRRLCEVAESDNCAVRLPDEVSTDHTIFLVPKSNGEAYRDRDRRLAVMLKLLNEVCRPDAGFTSLLITHFSHDADPTSLDPLRSIWHAIYNWHLFKDFGSLKKIFIGVHPDAAARVGSYIEDRSEFTTGFTDQTN